MDEQMSNMVFGNPTHAYTLEKHCWPLGLFRCGGNGDKP